MIRTLVGFSSTACLFAVLLSGCSSSQTSSQADPVEGVPANAGQEPTLQNDDVLSNSGPEGDSSLSVGARQYPLNAAIGDIWGVANNHFNVNFTLTDGKFTITPTTIAAITHNLLTPVKASGIFRADMYSPGDAFAFQTYSYALPNASRSALAGVAFFNNAFVGVDTDNSGDIDEDERSVVVGGTVEFTGAVPDIELNFSVTLSDGQLAEGHYTGLFDFTER